MSEDRASTEELTAHTDDCKGEGESESHTKTIEERLNRTVLAGICLSTAKDDTVNYDKRDINTQGRIQGRNISLH